MTLEFSNTTPLPAKVYANEGACQFLFLEGNGAVRGRPMPIAPAKYMGQRGGNAPQALTTPIPTA